jgi:hypothetical protein
VTNTIYTLPLFILSTLMWLMSSWCLWSRPLITPRVFHVLCYVSLLNVSFLCTKALILSDILLGVTGPLQALIPGLTIPMALFLMMRVKHNKSLLNKELFPSTTVTFYRNDQSIESLFVMCHSSFKYQLRPNQGHTRCLMCQSRRTKYLCRLGERKK